MPWSVGRTWAAPVDRRAQTGEALDDGRTTLPQLSLVIAEKKKVVHIAQIGGTAQLAGHEMVEAAQIAVRPELAGQVADRQPVWPTGSQKIVAREVCHVVLLAQHADAVVEDQPDEPADAAVLDPTVEVRSRSVWSIDGKNWTTSHCRT